MMKSLREKIGQMLIMGFPEAELQPDSPVVSWLSKDPLGGVLLFDYNMPAQSFDKNLKSREQIGLLNYQLNKYNRSDLPLFIAVDYEGGHVDRLKRITGCKKTISPFEQARLSVDKRKVELEEMATTLHELGFNLNFAPALDLNLNDQEGIIGALGRSYSDDPHRVSAIAREFVESFNAHGIVCCYKHFPGHGSAVGDTHEGFVDVTNTYSPIEVEPYALLAKNSTSQVMVMTAHVINRNLDPSGVPATLSYPILSELLRNKLHYDGIIISDDLQMQAISDHYSLDESLKLTINAGADMVIFGNQLGEIAAPVVIDCIEQLVNSGEISVSRIDDAYERIVRLKSSALSRSH